MIRLMRPLWVAVLLLLAAPAAWAQSYCPANSIHAKLITGTTYTIGSIDFCKTLTFTSGSSIAVGLPAPGTAGGFLMGFWTKLFAEGAGTVTITPTANAAGVTPTINGATSISLATTHSTTIYVGTDGNYYAPTAGG